MDYHKNWRGEGVVTLKCNDGLYVCVIGNKDAFYQEIIRDEINSVKNGRRGYETIFFEKEGVMSCKLIILFEESGDNIDFVLQRDKKKSGCVIM
ncbi:MAG: hypothetical protein Harvfovirus15_29 [Harvfovirus sp.]|uniref:Uncharacterized protein n=1 Tax=Harvfovirus sp. TaxID=2487768 RepID=A0A3G5A1L2_9VIRU|nr:MAG: hypothetical protein Harvfovirus15_29 [Harvfovirus sp.]